VSGLGSSVSDLNVSVSGLSHTLPDDIGLLLVSPAGQSTILMTASGDGTGVSGTNRTVTITAVPQKASKRATITITVDDGHGATAPVKVNVIAGSDKKGTINGTSDADMIFGLKRRRHDKGRGWQRHPPWRVRQRPARRRHGGRLLQRWVGHGRSNRL
jgi:hypothetical protein